MNEKHNKRCLLRVIRPGSDIRVISDHKVVVKVRRAAQAQAQAQATRSYQYTVDARAQEHKVSMVSPSPLLRQVLTLPLLYFNIIIT